jgi:hypothetical protein
MRALPLCRIPNSCAKAPLRSSTPAALATKITFINEIADLCERVGADVQEVARGIGFDNRIGPTAPFGALVYEPSSKVQLFQQQWVPGDITSDPWGLI